MDMGKTGCMELGKTGLNMDHKNIGNIFTMGILKSYIIYSGL